MTQSAQQIPDDITTTAHTPMMAQYHAVKAAHPDCLLFYRMGDFYEMFFDDAVIAAKTLDLTLTKRGKTQGTDIPMCGVPYHAAEPYIARLIRAGHKVAICEQCETPEEAKKRGGAKALVQRDVIRIITAGTLIEDSLLDSKSNNYLVAIADLGTQTGLAITDVSTGEILLQSCTAHHVINILSRLSPSEIICAPDYAGLSDSAELTALSSHLPPEHFSSDFGRLQLQKIYGDDFTPSLDTFNRAEIAAAGALLGYIENTQKGKFPYLSRPRHIGTHSVMDIDPSTIRSLELISTQNGNRLGSLIDTIDMTVTSAGARMMQSRLLAPLRDVDAISKRFDEVASFIDLYDVTKNIRTALKATPDLERAMGRISLQRGGPRDIAALRDGLNQAIIIRSLLLEKTSNHTSLHTLSNGIRLTDSLETFRNRLELALLESPPYLSRDGNFIREGFCASLDHLRTLRSETTRLIAGLQAKYVADTGIDSLKITYNNVLGYFIEVPARRADSMMVKSGVQENPYIHRQTMASAVRFTTPELAQLERDIMSSSDKALAIEETYFKEFVESAIALADDFAVIANHLAAIDVACAVATLAIDRNYTRPTITNGDEFSITSGRHPVVEFALKTNHKTFIPNDCTLNTHEKLWLLTGPNMAGKSTFLRQNALIAIMAQAGFYIPATSATIGVVDKVFSRVGASDDLARGHSTFMMEMVETAAILKNATSQSIVILDEVGRGTSTFDGLSLAWAVVEFLHNQLGCRGLFATHYHEITSLSTQLTSLACYTMDVKEWKDDVIFLHAVKSGIANRSYGIHVAKLAGVPKDVLERAAQVLHMLEDKKAAAPSQLAKLGELPLFAAPIVKPINAIEDALGQLNPDSLTPREALEALYSLHSLLGKC